MKSQTYLQSKRRDERISRIIKSYKLYKIRLLSDKDMPQQRKERYLRFTTKVEYCINSLKPSQCVIFTNSYTKSDYFWVESNYSSAHYYRLKKDSGIAFLKKYRYYKNEDI